MEVIRRVIKELPNAHNVDVLLSMLSQSTRIHCLHDNKPVVQKVLTERDYYTLNTDYEYASLEETEHRKKTCEREIADIKNEFLPRLFNIAPEPFLQTYSEMASRFLGKSSEAFQYALHHVPLIILHSTLYTTHYVDETETPLVMILHRMIDQDKVFIIERELSKLRTEDNTFFWKVLRFISVRFTQFITETSLKNQMFFIDIYDNNLTLLKSRITRELQAILQAYDDSTLQLNVPATAAGEPLYTINNEPEPLYEPIVNDYFVMPLEMIPSADEFIVNKHTVKEEKYHIQRKLRFSTVEQYVDPESVLDTITRMYEDITHHENVIAQDFGFPSIKEVFSDKDMVYLLEHYLLEDVVELDFHTVYDDPYEEVFNTDSRSFFYTMYERPYYEQFLAYEMSRKHRYYSRLIETIRDSSDGAGEPVLPLEIALHLAYSEVFEKEVQEKLHQLNTSVTKTKEQEDR